MTSPGLTVPSQTQLIVIMGVSGSGKSTIGNLLAEELGYSFKDADDFHSQANREKMHAETPLTDVDREPWLSEINNFLLMWQTSQTRGVLACSALKQAHREALWRGSGAEMLRFIYLKGSKNLIAKRLAQRNGHFMSPKLLQSQLSTIEPPHDALIVSIKQSPKEIVNQIIRALG